MGTLGVREAEGVLESVRRERETGERMPTDKHKSMRMQHVRVSGCLGIGVAGQCS